jgi:enoyl-CoA hydratase
MWEKQAAISGPVFASEDAKEGANAFKEKRAPVWRGR